MAAILAADCMVEYYRLAAISRPAIAANDTGRDAKADYAWGSAIEY
jgi:hypothetical protein